MPDNNTRILLDQLLKQSKSEAPGSLREDEYFEYFSAEQVLKDFDLDDDEIMDGIVGGGYDAGIDAIYTFANGHLYEDDFNEEELNDELNSYFSMDIFIFQAKRSPGFSQDVIDKLNASLPLVFSLTTPLPSSLFSDLLIQKVEQLRRFIKATASKFPKIQVHIYYTSKGSTLNISKGVKEKASQLELRLTEMISKTTCVFYFVGDRELLEKSRKEKSQSLRIEYENIASWDGNYIALVKLKDYAKFIRDDNGRLRKYIFDSNVRDFQGNTIVNSAIRETLLNPDSDSVDFWWLNNGVTIICAEASQTGQEIIVKHPQIVNGLQTSSVVHEAFRIYSDQLNNDERKILLRIFTTIDDNIRNKVIVATNSQTNLAAGAIRATEPFQRDIEQYFLQNGWYYDRKKNYYKNLKKPADKIVAIPFMAQAMLAAGFGEPSQARARAGGLIKQDSEYHRLFNREIDLAIYLWCAQLQKRVDLLSRAMDIPPSIRTNIRFHTTTYLIKFLLGRHVKHPAHLAPIISDDINDKEIEAKIRIVARKLRDYSKLHEDSTVDRISKSQAFTEYILKT